MWNKSHLLIKIILVVVTEAVVMSATYGFSKYIHHIHHPLTTHIIGGALLASLVVWLYNRMLLRKKKKVEQELKEITDVVLKKIPEDKDEMR